MRKVKAGVEERTILSESVESDLERLPYTDVHKHHVAEDITIYMHLFSGKTHWYIAGYDLQNKAAYGFVVPDGDVTRAKWERFDLEELRQFSVSGAVIKQDLGWEAKLAGDIVHLRGAYLSQRREDPKSPLFN